MCVIVYLRVVRNFNRPNVVQDAFDATADYPVTLQDSLDAIRGSLPPAPTVKAEDVLRRQGNIAKDMAGLLHSLTEHLDKMEDAANEGEQDFTEDDYQGEFIYDIGGK